MRSMGEGYAPRILTSPARRGPRYPSTTFGGSPPRAGEDLL
jgi:hypothetical protein